ncbi:MAG TPA: UbiA family prenyltransferase [Dehalococcoidia bacterium]|nr:UbiA family prenyltransferase [Dehalococcoidia bacterium]
MNIRTLIGLWKANIPVIVWAKIPLLAGLIILGLNGETPEWAPLALFLVIVALVAAIAESANTYVDREEDRIYFPSNPLVTGELAVATAGKALIVQNIITGLLLIALAVVTRNYQLLVVIIAGWLVALMYSLPPFRFKETVAAPFLPALGMALLTIATWLLVEPSLTVRNGFVIAFALFLFIFIFGFAVTIKFRKTFHALNSDLIMIESGNSIYDLDITGLGLKVKTAMALEAITTLGAFILVPILWHLEVFDRTLSIGLLALPLPLTSIGVVLRMKEPVENSQLCTMFITMACGSILLMLFAVALTTLIHWGFAILACLFFLLGFLLLLLTIQPVRRESLFAPWREL